MFKFLTMNLKKNYKSQTETNFQKNSLNTASLVKKKRKQRKLNRLPQKLITK